MCETFHSHSCNVGREREERKACILRERSGKLTMRDASPENGPT